VTTAPSKTATVARNCPENHGFPPEKRVQKPTELLLEDGIEIIRKRAKLNLKRLKEMKGSLSIPGWLIWFGKFLLGDVQRVLQIENVSNWHVRFMATCVQWSCLGEPSLRIPSKTP